MFLIGPFLTVATDSLLISSYGSRAIAMRCQWRVSCACLISCNCRLFLAKTRLRQNCGQMRRYFQPLSSCRGESPCFRSEKHCISNSQTERTVPPHPHPIYPLYWTMKWNISSLCVLPGWSFVHYKMDLTSWTCPLPKRSYLQAFSTSLWTSDIEWATRCKSVALSDPCHS